MVPTGRQASAAPHARAHTRARPDPAAGLRPDEAETGWVQPGYAPRESSIMVRGYVPPQAHAPAQKLAACVQPMCDAAQCARNTGSGAGCRTPL